MQERIPFLVQALSARYRPSVLLPRAVDVEQGARPLNGYGDPGMSRGRPKMPRIGSRKFNRIWMNKDARDWGSYPLYSSKRFRYHSSARRFLIQCWKAEVGARCE